MVLETPARQTKYGLVNDGEGWFVINAREARWRERESLGVYCDFEGKRPFPQLGINVSVLQPGESLGRYHRENGQEGFLVVAGECLVIVEGEERELKAWGFFHSPPQTEHIIVGAGEGPSVVVAVGARGSAAKASSTRSRKRHRSMASRSGRRRRSRLRPTPTFRGRAASHIGTAGSPIASRR